MNFLKRAVLAIPQIRRLWDSRNLLSQQNDILQMQLAEVRTQLPELQAQLAAVRAESSAKLQSTARQSGSEKHHVGVVHALENNYFLSKEQHAFCVALTGHVQDLYDDSLDYIRRNGLNQALHIPGNCWTDLRALTGMKFRTAYNDINYLRLTASYSSNHLSILDTLHSSIFPTAWAEEFVAKLYGQGIPTDIAEQVRKLYDPEARLRPRVDEYLDHIRNVPERYIARTPRLFGEVGIEINGVLVNADVILCQSRINGMLCSGVLDKLDADIARKGRARVLEIGPGHGGLAYALQTIFGDRLEYVCIDLPASLYHSALYLSTLSAGKRCHVLRSGDSVPEHFKFLFIANYMTDEFAAALGPVDLALNAMSFPEMTVEQVRYYGELLKRLLGSDGVVFEENAKILPQHTDIKAIFSEIFPYRKHVSSDFVTTKNWCQDVWSSRYIGGIFDFSDAMLLKRHTEECASVPQS